MASWLQTIIKFVLFQAILLAVLYAGFFDIWTVPDDPKLAAAIEPTLRPGEIVILQRRTPPGLEELARCTKPRYPELYVVGRFMALDTDNVDIINGRVLINSMASAESQACEIAQLDVPSPEDGKPKTLFCEAEKVRDISHSILRADFASPVVHAKAVKNKGYLVSDNRVFSYDSQELGLFNYKDCRRILFRIYSPDDASRRFTNFL